MRCRVTRMRCAVEREIPSSRAVSVTPTSPLSYARTRTSRAFVTDAKASVADGCLPSTMKEP